MPVLCLACLHPRHEAHPCLECGGGREVLEKQVGEYGHFQPAPLVAALSPARGGIGGGRGRRFAGVQGAAGLAAVVAAAAACCRQRPFQQPSVIRYLSARHCQLAGCSLAQGVQGPWPMRYRAHPASGESVSYGRKIPTTTSLGASFSSSVSWLSEVPATRGTRQQQRRRTRSRDMVLRFPPAATKQIAPRRGAPPPGRRKDLE